MRTIGLLGGMSWESTAHYYRVINEAVRERVGGLHSAELVVHSVDFAPIAELQARDAWADTAVILGVVPLLVLVYLVTSLLVDLSYAVLDPRIRYE